MAGKKVLSIPVVAAVCHLAKTILVFGEERIEEVPREHMGTSSFPRDK